MITLHFEKMSCIARENELSEIAIPVPQGTLKTAKSVRISDGETYIIPQTKVTATWPDGSIKWIHLVFPATLPSNDSIDYFCTLQEEKGELWEEQTHYNESTRTLDAGALQAILAPKGSRHIFQELRLGESVFSKEEITGPFLGSDGKKYTFQLEEDWQVLENGPYRTTVIGKGKHVHQDGSSLFDGEIELVFLAGKPWFEFRHRFIHREEQESLPLETLTLEIKQQDKTAKVAIGTSNYRTEIEKAVAAEGLKRVFDADDVLYVNLEHTPETFAGTFFADWRNDEKGICATHYQARQNFPKGFAVGEEGLEISLMPEQHQPLEILQGMAKTHSIYLHLHHGTESVEDLGIRSLFLQMPDLPTIEGSVYGKAKVFEDVFHDAQVQDIEKVLMRRLDAVSRAFGMLHFGDVPDPGYTMQGRANGNLVWVNGEYDYSHAAMLYYARSGERRVRDKFVASARHWMDVDICHYSPDPLRQDGQIAHSANHATGGVTPSHMWVEGLLDYYHHTGEQRALDLAVGIGKNVMRQLDSPKFSQDGQSSVREIGWALRTCSALYTETHDEAWLEQCEWVISHFFSWKETYGSWLSYYTDHSMIRIPFMISVAVGSVMRYYRVRPSDELKELMLFAVDDMLEHCILPSGLFFYKELPSMRYPSGNVLPLEALSYAYELSGDKRYIEAGLPLFRAFLSDNESLNAGQGGARHSTKDAVYTVGNSSKSFSQSHLPAALYYKALITSGVVEQL